MARKCCKTDPPCKNCPKRKKKHGKGEMHCPVLTETQPKRAVYLLHRA